MYVSFFIALQTVLRLSDYIEVTVVEALTQNSNKRKRFVKMYIFFFHKVTFFIQQISYEPGRVIFCSL